MLFKPEHVKMILSGQKTQSRRLWKKPMAKVDGTYKAKNKLFSKDYFAVLHVTKLWKEKLLDISEEDAKKEGYPSRGAFLQKFYDIYGLDPALGYNNLTVTALEWELVKIKFLGKEFNTRQEVIDYIMSLYDHHPTITVYDFREEKEAKHK